MSAARRLTKEEAKRVIEQMGGREKILRELEQFRFDNQFFQTHRSELLKKHPYRYVAIIDGAVVGTGKSLDSLLPRLRRRGIEMSRLMLEYLDPHPKPRILTKASLGVY